jgi:two-component system NtrC family sensor kinase
VAYTVLLIDDDQAVLQALSELLVAEDFEVATFSRGREALDWLQEHSAAVCLADFKLPDLDGLEMLEQVRQLRPTCQRALLSGVADLEMLQGGLNSGTVQYFLRKPWHRDEVFATVDGAVARHIQQERQEAMAELLRRQNEELDTMARQLETMVDRRTRQIERAKKEWERTFDVITSPLTQVNGSFELLRVNMATAQHAEKPVRELPGSRCYASIFGREEPCPGCPLNERVEELAEAGHLEAEIRDEGREKTFLLSVYEFDRTGAQPRYVCYYKDVTEEKKLQRQVMQSEKMAGIGQLAGGVAHELNNPIGVILSFTQFSLETARELGDEELLDNLQEVQGAAKRCKEIVGGLLEFSRPSLDEHLGLVNLNAILEKALFLVSTQKEMRNVEVVKELVEDLPLVLGNNNQLLQVLINLVRNGVQAMEGDGSLVLRSWADGRGRVCLSVKDSGPGIPARSLHRLFEPFFTTKAPGQGTGLGLSVSYGIIERHNGHIEVESREGEGAAFIVTLPPAPTGDEAD